MKKYLVEALGSFLYIALTSFAIISLNEVTSIITIALVSSITLTTLIYITQPISGGHINPIFTIGALITQKIEPIEGIIYILMQTVGAIFGTAVAIILNSGRYELAALSTQIVDPEISIITVVVVEFVCALLITLVFLMTSDDEDSTITLGLSIGLTSIGVFIASYLVDQLAFIPTKTIAIYLFTFDIDTLSNLTLFLSVPIFGALVAGLIKKMFE
jgi:aquaporin Z